MPDYVVLLAHFVLFQNRLMTSSAAEVPVENRIIHVPRRFVDHPSRHPGGTLAIGWSLSLGLTRCPIGFFEGFHHRP